MKKDLLSMSDLTPGDVREILDMAFEFKKRTSLGVQRDERLRGKVVAMIFEKPSLRTKVAFEVAAASLGATPVFLSSAQILASGQGTHGRESIPDIARNLERFTDLIIARVYSHKDLEVMAAACKKPVINILCDKHHPTQALADMMAITWHKKEPKGLNVSYVGDGNNVATSLMQACAMLGMNFSVASPEGYEIPQVERDVAAKFAKESGSKVSFFSDPKKAVVGADIVYTDTFISMGQEAERDERLKIFAPYQVNKELMKLAKPDALFMHNLPAHRGEEVTDEVFDSPQSIVFDEAECRLYIAKALLSMYM